MGVFLWALVLTDQSIWHPKMTLAEKLVVPQHKEEAEVWQTSRWVRLILPHGAEGSWLIRNSSIAITSLSHRLVGLGEHGLMLASG